jgi:hypothetical protein
MIFAIQVYSAVIALVVGVQAFTAVFFAPVVIYGDDNILLVWGWIAPFLGLPVALLLGKLVRKGLNEALCNAYRVNSTRLSRTVGIVAVTFASVTTVGLLMATTGNTTLQWIENVELNDGKFLMVSRKVFGNSFGRPEGQPTAWLPSEFTVTFKENGSLSQAFIWQSSLRPILLERDVVIGSWYLIAEPVDCREWYRLGSPQPAYFTYILASDGWKSVPFDGKFIGRSPNLLLAPRFTGEQSTVWATTTKERNNYGRADDKPKVLVSASGC